MAENSNSRERIAFYQGDPVWKRQYEVFGVRLQVEAETEDALHRLERWLTVPHARDLLPPDARLQLREAEPAGFEALLPLPDKSCLMMSQEVDLGNRVTQLSVFRDDTGVWNDYAGVCRIFIPASEACARAVSAPHALPFPDYREILTGINPLNRLLRFSDIHLVHGSCVEVDGKGVLFVGQSFRGKSTAAYALMRQGHPVLNDDRVLVWATPQGYRAGTLSDVFKLREQALAQFFPELAEQEPMGWLAGERLYRISQIPGLNYSASCPLHSVLMLEKTGRPETGFAEVHPARLVEELLPGSLSAYDPVWSRRSFEFLMEMIARVPCGQVLFGTDMERFAAAVRQWTHDDTD